MEFKTKEAEHRLSKYLDAMEIIAPEKIVNAADYDAFYEAKRRDVEEQRS